MTKHRGLVTNPDGQEVDLRVVMVPFYSAYPVDHRNQRNATAEKAAEQISMIPCETPEQYEQVGGLLKSCKLHYKQADDFRKQIVAPLLEAKREIDGWFKPELSAFKTCEKVLKSKLVDYQKIHAQKQLQTLQQIGEQHTAGDHASVVALSANLTAVPSVAGVRTVERQSFEVLDMAAVPDRFKVIDRAAILEAIRNGETIPGIQPTTETTIAASTKG